MRIADPPDPELRDALLKCTKLKYTQMQKLEYLKMELELDIG